MRPHPLRETQIGCFLRTMATTESQLWAGTECAVRVWNFKDLYSAAGQGDLGDEETVPFRESVCTSAVICLVKDEGSRVVWSGHRDGRIRCWKMESATPIPANPFKEGLSWQAHRGPVLSLVISCYGMVNLSTTSLTFFNINTIYLHCLTWPLIQGICGRVQRVVSSRYGHGKLLKKLSP